MFCEWIWLEFCLTFQRIPAMFPSFKKCTFMESASLCAHVGQLVKNLPAMRETWVWSLGWEDLLENGKANHSSILAWRIPWTVHGVPKSWTRLSNFHFHLHMSCSHTCLWVFISFYFNHFWVIWGIGQFCIVFFFALYPFLSLPLERFNFQFQGIFLLYIFCIVQDIAQYLTFWY